MQTKLNSHLAGGDPWLAFLAFQNTPIQGLTTSPLTRICGRRTRATLPTRWSLLTQSSENERPSMLRHQQK